MPQRCQRHRSSPSERSTPPSVGFIASSVAGIAGELPMTSTTGETPFGVLVDDTTIPSATDLSLAVLHHRRRPAR